jgi:hypothetical protein
MGIGHFMFVVTTHFIFEGNDRGSVNPFTAVSIYRLLIQAIKIIAMTTINYRKLS